MTERQKSCPMCKSKNYDGKKGCNDCGFAGLCMSDEKPSTS